MVGARPLERISLVLLLLLAATLASAVFGWHAAGMDQRWSATIILLIAAFKTRMVILEFMELRTAPVLLNVLGQAWLSVLAALLIALQWMGGAGA